LANISLGAGKIDQAAGILGRLSQNHPDSWEVERSLGYLHWYGANRDLARIHFGRAAEKGMTDARTYLEYAELLGETGIAAAEIIPLVSKALELQPGNRSASLKLASLHLSTGKFDETIFCVHKMGEFRPHEAFHAHSLLAYAHLGLRQLDQARKSAENARLFARTETDKSEIEQLFRALAQQEIPAQPARTIVLPTEPALPPPTEVAAKPAVVATIDTAVHLQPQVLQVKGKLQRIDCLGDRLRLILQVSGKEVALLVTNPQGLAVKGRETEVVGFYCGAQPDTPVVITYIPKPDARLGTAGQVTIIQFLD